MGDKYMEIGYLWGIASNIVFLNIKKKLYIRKSGLFYFGLFDNIK